MEVKNMILSVLIMSLVISQIQVEAKICCSDEITRGCFNICRFAEQFCAKLCSCKDIAGPTCPPGYTNDILENSAQGDDVNRYCKLGCASSVCGALTTLQNSDASEIVNGAVAQCTKACSALCTKGSAKAVSTA
ncbi:PREDICTED: thionin-2.2-like [Camelina sativa]|uniref:Thionin-2.2-like n=1 Tax=Camelina sativa TaxID=90675 RepID=A0ABM0YGL4_CAMSA|nr:PREDICTED: thionin-2.2-like [Camelina sativa]